MIRTLVFGSSILVIAENFSDALRNRNPTFEPAPGRIAAGHRGAVDGAAAAPAVGAGNCRPGPSCRLQTLQHAKAGSRSRRDPPKARWPAAWPSKTRPCLCCFPQAGTRSCS